MTKLNLSLPKFTFLREVYKEMKHVTWPTLKNTAIFTTLIIVFTVIFAYFISAVDLGFIEALGGMRRWIGDAPALPTSIETSLQGGAILDSEGNEIKVENIITGDDLKNIDVTPKSQ